MSRRFGEAMGGDRSGDRSGIEYGSLSLASSGLKSGSGCAHLSRACSMPGARLCSGARGSPNGAGDDRLRKVVDWPKPLMSNDLGRNWTGKAG